MMVCVCGMLIWVLVVLVVVVVEVVLDSISRVMVYE